MLGGENIGALNWGRARGAALCEPAGGCRARTRRTRRYGGWIDENADMARDPRCIWPPPPGASAGDARTGSSWLAGAARRRDERARRARAPRAVRARRRALLRRSARSRGRRLAAVARRVAAAR